MGLRRDSRFGAANIVDEALASRKRENADGKLKLLSSSSAVIVSGRLDRKPSKS
jgi:hypothetical protein